MGEAKELPGHIRQRIRRAITALAHEPRPADSKALIRPDSDDTISTAGASLEPVRELRRIRLERRRIVYAITESDQTIDVLTIRKRPPYDYGDIERLLATL